MSMFLLYPFWIHKTESPFPCLILSKIWTTGTENMTWLLRFCKVTYRRQKTPRMRRELHSRCFAWPQFIPHPRPEYTETVEIRVPERMCFRAERGGNGRKQAETGTPKFFGTVSKNDGLWRVRILEKPYFTRHFSIWTLFEPSQNQRLTTVSPLHFPA